MNALILDTETHDLNGYPIEIAHVACDLVNHQLFVDEDWIFDQFYSCPEPISFAAMAVHHILESDLIGKPSYDTFRLPENVTYLIGHNVDYDIQAIQKCDSSIQVKGICTLALSRMVWPDASAHNLSTLYYMVEGPTDQTRKELRNAHNAAADIMFTARILAWIIKATGVKDMDALYALSEEARIPKKLTFGKHNGMLIKDVPADYKAWLLKQSDIDPYLRKALEA